MKQFAAVLAGFVLGGVTSIVTSSVALQQMVIPAVKEGTSVAISQSKTEPPLVDVSSIKRCDELASHPGDINRQFAGVSDGDLALGAAISACAEAITIAPTNPRLQFQLGRVLWEAGRHSEAFEAFVNAAQDPGYGAAEKFIGDAYRDGKGLPQDQQQSADVALEWYEISVKNGFKPAQADVVATREYIKKLRFDPSLFQNPRIMEILYNGNLQDTKNTVELFHMISGFYKFLDSEQAVDHAPKCKTMFGLFDMQKAKLGEIAGYVDAFTSSNASIEKKILSTVTNIVKGTYQVDSGQRDALNLINHYGCDSAVGRTIIRNIKKSEQLLFSKANSALGNINRLLK